MANKRDAILQAVMAADRLHKEFDTKSVAESGVGRIDVFDMFVKYDLPLVFRPLNKLLGAFLDEDSPGVLVTTQRQLPIQRFTAGHELGHYVLKHKPHADDETSIFRSNEITAGTDLQEVQANSFSSELLMPRWLIASHMKRQEWTPEDIVRPEVIYQLSLRLGTSYSGTCYALFTNKIIARPVYDSLVELQVKKIKQPFIGSHEPVNWKGDMWLITERDDGLCVQGSRSDLVVLHFAEHSGSGYIWRLDDLVSAGLEIVSDQRSANGPEDVVGGIITRNVIAEAKNGAKGVVKLRELRPWQVAGKAIKSVDLDVDLNGPMRQGLLPKQREAALGAN